MDRNSGQLALSSSNNQISVGQNTHDRDSQAKKSLDWSDSLVDSFLDVDLEDVSSFGATVDIGVLKVKGCAGKLPLDVAEISV